MKKQTYHFPVFRKSTTVFYMLVLLAIVVLILTIEENMNPVNSITGAYKEVRFGIWVDDTVYSKTNPILLPEKGWQTKVKLNPVRVYQIKTGSNLNMIVNDIETHATSNFNRLVQKDFESPFRNQIATYKLKQILSTLSFDKKVAACLRMVPEQYGVDRDAEFIVVVRPEYKRGMIPGFTVNWFDVYGVYEYYDAKTKRKICEFESGCLGSIDIYSGLLRTCIGY